MKTQREIVLPDSISMFGDRSIECEFTHNLGPGFFKPPASEIKMGGKRFRVTGHKQRLDENGEIVLDIEAKEIA